MSLQRDVLDVGWGLMDDVTANGCASDLGPSKTWVYKVLILYILDIPMFY